MDIYELRAIWREGYVCPDNGPTYICDASGTIMNVDILLLKLQRELRRLCFG